MTDEFGIGKTFKAGPLGQRDAVHAAVVLVSSDEEIYPGDSLIFSDDSYSYVSSVRHPEPSEEGYDDYGESEEANGEGLEGLTLKRQAVADPFVSSGTIPAGQLFWAFLIPGSTEGLRHVFEIKNVKETFDDPFEPRANAQDSCRGCF